LEIDSTKVRSWLFNKQPTLEDCTPEFPDHFNYKSLKIAIYDNRAHNIDLCVSCARKEALDALGIFIKYIEDKNG